MLEATTLFRMEEAPLLLFDVSICFVESVRVAASGVGFFVSLVCACVLLFPSFEGASSENMLVMFPFK